MNSEREKAIVKRIDDRVTALKEMHKNGTIFNQGVLKNLREEARAEAEKIIAVARNNGFDVSDAYSPNNTLNKLFFGDIHHFPGDARFMIYTPAFVGIMKGLISEGILKPGDKYCFEGDIAGKIDYEKSRLEKGNKNVIAMRSGDNVQTMTVYDQSKLVALFDILKDNGIEAVCNDYPRLKGLFTAGTGKYLEMLAECDKMLAKPGLTEDEQKKAEKHYERAKKVRHEAFSALLAKILKGFAASLNDMPGRAVQVCGTIDIFTELMQNNLKANQDSYIVLLPRDPNY